MGCLLYPSFFSLGCSNQPQTSEAYHREGSFLSLLRVGGRGSALLSSLFGSRLSTDPTLMCPLVAERREDTLTSRCFVRRLLPGSAVTSAPTPSAKAWPEAEAESGRGEGERPPTSPGDTCCPRGCWRGAEDPQGENELCHAPSF